MTARLAVVVIASGLVVFGIVRCRRHAASHIGGINSPMAEVLYTSPFEPPPLNTASCGKMGATVRASEASSFAPAAACGVKRDIGGAWGGLDVQGCTNAASAGMRWSCTLVTARWLLKEK